MKRMDYRTALRAKGIKPIPSFEKLRTNHRADVNDVIVKSEKAA